MITRPGIVLAFALWLAGCSSCSDPSVVAELLEKREVVERDFARAQNVWSTAEPGARWQMGDALRTGPASQATLALAKRGRLLVKSNTVVRFLKSFDPAAPEAQLDVVQGELTVETGGEERTVRTPRGLVTLKQASTVRVRAQEEKLRFDVEVGRVEYSVEGKRQLAEAGTGFDLEVLPVSVERTESQQLAAAAVAPVLEAALPQLEPAERAAPELGWAESPAHAVAVFEAGESVTVHDPAPPSELGVSFEGCPELAALELDRGNGRFDALRVRGHAELRARVARGVYRYRVRCVHDGRPAGRAAASGTIKVVVDAATRPLPQSSVTITADADGRRYTVNYQNRLPTITLRWPYAPQAKSFRLVVRPAQAAEFAVESRQSSVTLAPGRLGEGLHNFWFEAEGQRSENGTLHVAFDYTARTAYLTSPPERAAVRDGSVRFAGGTLLGSRVQIAGTRLELDAHGRFATTVPMTSEVKGAAVRVQHPSTGIHYYVRHLTF
ncbi:MAG TPA: FecR domain-containing protein [Polyangiales bacterium]|nr:FecR domain-containing protein [Polyangiales bacterium]